MSSTRNFRWFPLAALVGCALVLGIAATSALAAESPWGELRRFGPTGKAAPTITPTTNAFGVDPKTGDVFIGDEPSGEGKYRLQELDSKGNQLSSVTLTPKTQLAAEQPEKLRGSPAGIEGVAIDSARERVYVLVVYERAEVTEAQEKHGEELIDEDEDDAGILYAFSTKGGKLEPVAGTTEGVLANAGTLKAQGEAFGEALLEPAGLSVDPTNGDVVLLGQVEEGDETRHLAVQRISDAGAPGARYVAPVEVDEEEAGGGTNSEESTSPVVSASGQVYVEQSNKIVQIPTGFGSTSAPTPVFALTGSEALLELGTARAEASFGGGMSIAPEASGGKLFTTALIREPAPHGEVGGTYYLGALSLHYSDSAPNGSATELGWTGGSNASIGPQCVLSVEGPRPEVAAGPEGHILVFDPHARQVVEFGPKGSGCPTAHASAVTTTVAGAPLPEVGGVASVPAGTTVNLSATVPQANALGVQWVYEEGQPAQAGTPHGPVAEGSHAFAKTGETTIKGTIETDDLATPTITVEKKIKVTQAPPTASFTTTSAGPGEAVEFNAGSTSDPSHASITKYAWKFGDGHEETTTGPIARHAYAAVGTYTATLTVTDSLGLEGSTTRSVVVATKTTGGGGGGGSTGSGSTPSAPAAPKAAAPTPPPPATGVGGVLSYRASLASTSLAVSSSGALVVKVDCLGQSSCAGTVTLRTLTAVAASARAAKSKKAILTLASGSFTLAGGHAKAVTLHLSAKARKLLAHSHVLRARATILARDAKGVTHTTAIVVTLRPAKAKHH